MEQLWGYIPTEIPTVFVWMRERVCVYVSECENECKVCVHMIAQVCACVCHVEGKRGGWGRLKQRVRACVRVCVEHMRLEAATTSLSRKKV